MSVFSAFLLTVVAGLFTGVGSLIALLAKDTNKKFLSASLGFSAGVMIYVSMVEIFFKAKESLTLSLGEKNGYIVTVVSFFAGALIIGLIDNLIPSTINPHEAKSSEGEVENISGEELSEEEKKNKLLRMGAFTALAVGIHNFPEGFATFISALQDPEIAIPIVVAIAMHNIPEGIAVSVPIYHSTGSKKKAFIYSFLSGLSEPIGAIVGYMVLLPFMSDTLLGIVFAAVAGIMVFISVDELLPAAREYGESHISIYGFFAGMAVMAISLLLFA